MNRISWAHADRCGIPQPCAEPEIWVTSTEMVVLTGSRPFMELGWIGHLKYGNGMDDYE
jgi:hypothetical protein